MATNPDGTTRNIDDIQEVVISGLNQQTGIGNVNVGDSLSSVVIEQTWLELRPWIEACLKDLNRDPLDHCREVARNDVERWIKQISKQTDNKKLEEHLQIIQGVKSIQELLDKYIEIRNNELLSKIDKKDELINVKGYSERDVTLLKEWGLTEQGSDYFPNLYDERRVGVTNLMYTCGGENGGTNEVIIFLKPKNNQSESSVNFSCNWGEWEGGYRRIIHNFLKEQNSSADVYVLMRMIERGGGNSAGIGHYLALYSAFHKIPLPRNLGSTGTVESEKVGKIGGLRWKLKGAVNKKNVRKQLDKVDVFILSEENKKDEKYSIQSYVDTPDFIKKEVKQVHFVKQKKELEKHLNEVLTEPKTKKKCSEKEEEDPKPREPPINSQITSDQLLTLITELSISKEVENQDFWEKLQNAYAKNVNYQEAVNQTKNLQQEYLGKLEKIQSEPNQRNGNKQAQIIKLQTKLTELEEQAKKWNELSDKATTDDEKIMWQGKIKGLVDKRFILISQLKNLSENDEPPTDIEAKKQKLYQEYQSKFQTITSSVTDSTKEILTNLVNFGYSIQEIKWTNELHAPSLTDESTVSFSLVKK